MILKYRMGWVGLDSVGSSSKLLSPKLDHNSRQSGRRTSRHGDVRWDEDPRVTEESLIFVLCSLYAAYSS